MLEPVAQEMERAGYEVKGLAPTTGGSVRLAESGLPSLCKSTYNVVKASLDMPPVGSNLVDGSSLTSGAASAGSQAGAEAAALFGRTNGHHAMMQDFSVGLQPNERIVLTVDRRRRQAVEAGEMSEQLQREGMATTELDTIVRQEKRLVVTARRSATWDRIALTNPRCYN